MVAQVEARGLALAQVPPQQACACWRVVALLTVDGHIAYPLRLDDMEQPVEVVKDLRHHVRLVLRLHRLVLWVRAVVHDAVHIEVETVEAGHSVPIDRVIDQRVALRKPSGGATQHGNTRAAAISAELFLCLSLPCCCSSRCCMAGRGPQQLHRAVAASTPAMPHVLSPIARPSKVGFPL